jgi:hypothetical protein
MLDPETLAELTAQIADRVAGDRALLDELLEEVRPLSTKQIRISPRSTTSVSMVATDGGNNQVRFDPFLVQVVRIVDSNQNQRWLEVVTPTTSVAELDARHLSAPNKPISPLGRMMADLGLSSVADLSPVLRDGTADRPRSPSWTNVYRELTEWAVLLDLVKLNYGSDTLIIFDGFLRSKIFKGALFRDYGALLTQAIEQHKRNRRSLYIVGLAKRSAVLTRYRLAMKLSRILRGAFPAYVEVPRELEQRAYVWSEYARGRGDESAGEVAKFVNGKMYFVKFGNRSFDTIWPVDIFEPQASQASTALGYLVRDAEEGFPISLYPRSLQRAHEAAALVGLDMDFLQDVIVEGVRRALGSQRAVLDEFIFEPTDPTESRYG